MSGPGDEGEYVRPLEKRRGRSLPQAVGTAIVLLGLVAAAYVVGPDGFFVLACAAVALALFELLDAVRSTGRRIVRTFGVLAGLAPMTAAYLAPERPEWVLAAFAAGVYGVFLLGLRPDRGSRPASDISWTIGALVWVAGGGAAATSMLALDGGLNLLVAHVLVTALGDIGAFFAGTTFGRHKLAPSISPAKSWEGAVAGLMTSVAAGGVAGLLIPQLGAAFGLGLGAIAGTLAPAGDLVESLAKRELGIKDSGRTLPGHGGMLDRLDAIIFAAPPALLYLRLFVF